jgi:hypothetical protein
VSALVSLVVENMSSCGILQYETSGGWEGWELDSAGICGVSVVLVLIACCSDKTADRYRAPRGPRMFKKRNGISKVSKFERIWGVIGGWNNNLYVSQHTWINNSRYRYFEMYNMYVRLWCIIYCLQFCEM